MTEHRREFTRDEADQIRGLLREVRRADRSRQKSLRAKLRRIGFYISDYAHDQAGFSASDFDDLVQRGTVTIGSAALGSQAERVTPPGHAAPDSGPAPQIQSATTGLTATPARAISDLERVGGGATGWSRAELEAKGFGGWITFEALRGQLVEVTSAGGVYVVVQAVGSEAEFRDTNPGGRFKDQDPTVDAAALQANWVEGAEVVYVGKADNLRRRLSDFARFGAGKPVGHSGGRMIWQLARSTDLLVAWRETPGAVPKDVETRLLAEFRAAYGKPPFANEPHRLGR